jgi:ubiquinone/menaquinone biosynthesis C-methylase UbiE
MGGSCIISDFFPNKIIDYDASKEMLKMSNAKMNVLGTVDKMPFKENSIDVVTCLGNSFPMLSPEELIKFFKESSKVLKKDGKIFLSFFILPFFSYNIKLLIKFNMVRFLAIPFKGNLLTKTRKIFKKVGVYPSIYIRYQLENSGFHKIKFERGINTLFMVTAEKKL